MTFVAKLAYNRYADYALKLPVVCSEIVRKTLFDVQAGAQAHVPVVTGNLKNSIATETEGDGLSGQVFTNVAYAARIEFGFVGADRLGRVYNQAPQPYMLPAAEAARPGFEMAFVQLERHLA